MARGKILFPPTLPSIDHFPVQGSTSIVRRGGTLTYGHGATAVVRLFTEPAIGHFPVLGSTPIVRRVKCQFGHGAFSVVCLRPLTAIGYFPV